MVVTACLLQNEPASYFTWRGESRSESESEQGVIVAWNRPETV
jgi:hypothetical protein